MENKEALFESIFNRELEDVETTGYLENITNAYPFFTPAQFYLLLQTPKNSSNYQRQIQKTASLFNNNFWLNYLLTQSAKDQQFFEEDAFKTEEIIADLGPAPQTEEPPTSNLPHLSWEVANEATIHQQDLEIEDKATVDEKLTEDHSPAIEPATVSVYTEESGINFAPDTTAETAVQDAAVDIVPHSELLSPPTENVPPLQEIPTPVGETEGIAASENEAASTLPHPDNSVSVTNDHAVEYQNQPLEETETAKVEVPPASVDYSYQQEEIPATMEEENQEAPQQNAVTIAESVAQENESLKETTSPDSDDQAAVLQDEVLAEVLTEINTEQPIEVSPINTEQDSDDSTDAESFAEEKKSPKETTFVDSDEQAAGVQDAVLAEVLNEINSEQPLADTLVAAEQESTDSAAMNDREWQHSNVVIAPEDINTEIPPNETPLAIPPIQEVPVNDQLLFEPLHTSDYFASVGIKLTEEQHQNDRLGKQLKSFTQWLKTMKRIESRHSEPLQPIESGAEPADHSIQQMAEFSNQGEEIITEAMADVLVQQGRKSKAIAVLEKLSLLNPSKSTYFAAKIDQLKE